MHKLTELQVAYEGLEESAQKQARMESELRRDLEQQLHRAVAARSVQTSGAGRVQQLEAELWRRDNELNEAESRLRSMENDLEEATRMVKKVSASQGGDPAVEKLLRTELAESKASLSHTKLEAEESSKVATKQIATMKAEAHALFGDKQDSDAEVDRFKMEAVQTEARLSQKIKELTVLRADASVSKAGKAAAESELDATKMQLDLLAEEAATKTRTISKLQGAVGAMKDAILEMKAQGDELQERHAEKLEELRTSRATEVSKTKELAAAKQDLVAANESSEIDRNASSNERLRLEQQISRLSSYEEQVRTLEETVRELQTQLASAEERDAEGRIASAAISTQELEKSRAAVSKLTSDLADARKEGKTLAAELTEASAAAAAANDALAANAASTADAVATARAAVTSAERERAAAIDVAAEQHASLKAELAASAAVVERLTEALAQNNTEAAGVDASNAERVAELEDEVARKVEPSVVEQQVADHEAALAVLHEKLDALQKRSQEATASLKEDAASSLSSLELLKQERDTHAAQSEARKAELRTSTARHAAVKKELMTTAKRQGEMQTKLEQAIEKQHVASELLEQEKAERVKGAAAAALQLNAVNVKAEKEKEERAAAAASVAAALKARVVDLEGKANQHAAATKQLEVKLAAAAKELDVVVERNQKGKAALAAAKDECSTAASRAKVLEEERDALQAKGLDATRTFQASIASANGAAAAELQALKDEVQRSETIATQERAKVEKLSSQRAELQGELASFRADVSVKDEALQEHQERAQRAEADRSSAERALEREKQSRASTITALQRKLEEAEASATAQNEKVVALQANFAGISAEADEQATTRAADAADSVAKLESKIVILTEQKSQQHDEVTQLQLLLGTRSDQIMALERSKQELEEQIVSDRIANLMKQAGALDEQIEVLELEGARKNKAKINVLMDQREQHVVSLKEQFDRQKSLLEVGSRAEIALLGPSASTSSRAGAGCVARADGSSGAVSDGGSVGGGGTEDGSGGGGGGGMGGTSDSGGGGDGAAAGGPPVSELADTILQRQADGAKLRKYIEQLVAEVFTHDEKKAMEVMNGLPKLEDAAGTVAASAELGVEVLKQLQSQEEATIASFEQYIDDLLGRIVEHCPEMMDTSAILSSLLG